MARVAADNGIPLEQATFEDWRPSGRSFDLVVFAQSFHWVQPQAGTRQDRVYPAPWRSPGTAVQPNHARIQDRQELDEAYVGHLDASARPAIDAAHDEELMTMIQTRGYTVERRHVTERLHYTTDAWVNMVFTYSNVLALAAQARADLRFRLEHRIGTAGVDAQKRRHRGNLHARVAVPADEPPRFVVDRSSTLSKHFSPGLYSFTAPQARQRSSTLRPLKRASPQSWAYADEANTPESNMRLYQ